MAVMSSRCSFCVYGRLDMLLDEWHRGAVRMEWSYLQASLEMQASGEVPWAAPCNRCGSLPGVR